MEDILFTKVFPSSIQVALFFPSDTNYKAIELANIVSAKFADVFTVDPNVISLPPGTPVEIPNIMFEQENIGRLNISYMRADLVLMNTNQSPECIDMIAKYSEALVSSLVNSGINIVRIGLVLTCLLDKSITVDKIKEKYICNDKLTGASNLELSWLKIVNQAGLSLNQWVRIIMSSLPGENSSIIIDANTLAEEKLDIEKYPVGRIIEMFMSQIKGGFNDVIEW